MFGAETEVPIGQPLRSSTGISHGSSSNLEIQSHGDENTLEYRIKGVDKSGAKPISLWHDVTLVHVDPATDRPTPYLNFVCEIPKFSRYVVSFCLIKATFPNFSPKNTPISRKKFEIATDEVGNFIKQDEKKGVLREVSIIQPLIIFHFCSQISSNTLVYSSFSSRRVIFSSTTAAFQ